MDLKHCTAVLFVKDAKKSCDFYVNTLGFTVVMNNGDLNYMFKEGLAIWQITDDNIIPKTLGSENIYNSKAASRFEVCFETDDLDGVYNTLKEQSVKLLHEINTEIWGQRNIRFYDLDGHLFEVGEAMPIFLKRIYEEEGEDIEATAKRTFTTPEVLRHFLGINDL